MAEGPYVELSPEESRAYQKLLDVFRRRGIGVEKYQAAWELERDERGHTLAEAHGRVIEIRLGKLMVSIMLVKKIIH